MKLQRIVVENFRQFYGKQEIVFATAKGKNVTVIHAENGFGKTALLNAILWGLYGARGLTEDLEKKSKIVTDSLREQSRSPEDDTAKVELTFEQDVEEGEERYTLTRSLSLAQERSDSEKTSLELQRQMTDGSNLTIVNGEAQKIIDSLIPPAIAPLLFFDGEGIDHLAMEASSETVQEAIHQMLGLKLLASAIGDLKHGSVRGVLQKELRENTDTETKALIDRRDKKKLECADKETSLENAKNTEATALAEIRAIDDNLRANEKARQLQERRSLLEGEQKRLVEQLHNTTRRLAAAIAEDGYALLAPELLARVVQITNRMRTAGEMPAKVMNSFIDELLRTNKCICGTELSEGSACREAVRKLLSRAADEHFNKAVEKLDNAVGVMTDAIPRAKTTIDQLTRDRAGAKARMAEIKEQLADVHTQLDGKDDALVHELEAKRTEYSEQARRAHGDQRVLQGAIEQLKQEIETLDREIRQCEQKDEIAKRAQRRINTVDDTVSLLEQMLRAETEDLREELGSEIRKHFDRIKIKPDHWLELTNDFTLQLKKWSSPNVETVVAPSKGERQVMSLVFIASLVALAKRRSDIPTVLKGVEGAEYPVVMDSPFGAFGDNFRAGVAKWIPQLAPQVIVLVSSTQFRGEVEAALTESGRVGRRYLLVYHAPTKKDEASDSITLSGKRHRQFFEDDVEHTLIKPIEV